MKSRKIDLAGCKLILKDGRAPKLKISRSKRRELSRLMAGGIKLADSGARMAGRQIKKVSKEMPAIRRGMVKRGKKLRRQIKKRMK